MAWTTDQPIRVGDNVTNLMLGQLASDISALHDSGFPNWSGASFTPTASIVGVPSGLESSGQAAPYVVYSFNNGYRRKPPYFVTATLTMQRPTSAYVGIWIIRQSTYVKDTRRENTGTTYGYNDWLTEQANGMFINNYEATSTPDAWLEVPTTDSYHSFAVSRFYADELPQRITYTNGTTYAYYNDYFHIAAAPMDGSAANLPAIFGALT